MIQLRYHSWEIASQLLHIHTWCDCWCCLAADVQFLGLSGGQDWVSKRQRIIWPREEGIIVLTYIFLPVKKPSKIQTGAAIFFPYKWSNRNYQKPLYTEEWHTPFSLTSKCKCLKSTTTVPSIFNSGSVIRNHVSQLFLNNAL